MEKWASFWWRTIPSRAASVSVTGALCLADGAYLAAWPVAAALAPPVACLIGMFLGWAHTGYIEPNATVFIASLVTFVVLLLVGSHGAALGAYAWAGYAIGDMILYALTAPEVASRAPSPGARLLEIVGTRALADGVLALLIVVVPFATRNIAQATLARRRSAASTPVWRILLPAATQFILVYMWLSAAALLLQATFTWQNYGPMTHGLVQRLRDVSLTVALVGGYAAAVRGALEAIAERAPACVLMRARFRAVVRQRFVRRILPVDLGSSLAAALALTFLMGSTLASWTDAAGLFAALAVALAVRDLLAHFAPGWARAALRVPLAIRFAAGLAAIYVAAAIVLQFNGGADNTFLPAKLAAVSATVIFALIIPGRAAFAPARAMGARP